LSWKPWAAGALLAGYAVTFVFGVPATKQSFLSSWVDHRLGVSVREGHAPFTSEETEELRKDAESIVSVHRVVPLFPGILMVEYDENYAFGSVNSRALMLWYPAAVHVILDAA